MTKTIALELPFKNEVWLIEGDVQVGKVFCVKDGVEAEATWPAWAISNRPGYQIDRAYHAVKAGKVSCIDSTCYQTALKIKTAPNGVKFAI